MAIQIKPRTLSAFRKAPQDSSVAAKSMPQKYFVSPEIFATEQERIFSTNWLLVGHQSQIPNAGDYFVAEVCPPSSDYGATGPGSESLIVIRNSNFEIRVFFNVCRHRGTRLKEDSCGHSATIQCPYHAWTYGLDGKLIGAPHMDEVPGFKKADYPLHSVKVGLWEGFIFVNLTDGEARLRSEASVSAEVRRDKPARQRSGDFVSLERWFAPLAGKFSHWNIPILRRAKRIEYHVGANWKLMFENYSECYHCPGVHPQLQKVSPYDSAENDLREGPFLGGFMRINPGKSLTKSGNACASFVGKIEDLQQVFYYSIFPNMLLSLHPEYVMVHRLWPQSPERTLIICDWLFHPDAFERKDFKPEDATEFWDITNRQDWHMCELSQKGISSRAYQPGSYSSRESIPAAWDEYYLRIMK